MSNLQIPRSLSALAPFVIAALLLAACGGAGLATPTAIPADIVRPDQPTPVLSTAMPRFRLEESTREPVFVTTPAAQGDGSFDAATLERQRAALLASFLMDQPPSALGIAPGGATIVDNPGGRFVASVPAAGTVTVTGRSADGAWLAVFTEASVGGWVPAQSLILYGADDLTVVDKPFAPAPVATLLAKAMTPVSTPLAAIIERRAQTPTAVPPDVAGNGQSATGGPLQVSVGRISGGNNVNLRAGPSTSTTALASLAPGSNLVVFRLSEDGAWYQVRTPEGDGWVATSLVVISDR